MNNLLVRLMFFALLILLSLAAFAEDDAFIIGKWRLEDSTSIGDMWESKSTFDFDFRKDSSVIVEQFFVSSIHKKDGTTEGPSRSFRMLSAKWSQENDKVIIRDVYRNDITPPDKKEGSFDSSDKAIDFKFTLGKTFWGNRTFCSDNFKVCLEKN